MEKAIVSVMWEVFKEARETEGDHDESGYGSPHSTPHSTPFQSPQNTPSTPSTPSQALRGIGEARNKLEAREAQLEERERAFEAREAQFIQSFQKVNMLIVELQSDALKDRHWKTLWKELSELTLGQVWDVDLQKHESIVKDIILIAQGKMALEEFLKQVKETWNTYKLDLINYQNKCRIIRGWDVLFDKLKENQQPGIVMGLENHPKCS